MTSFTRYSWNLESMKQRVNKMLLLTFSNKPRSSKESPRQNHDCWDIAPPPRDTCCIWKKPLRKTQSFKLRTPKEHKKYYGLNRVAPVATPGFPDLMYWATKEGPVCHRVDPMEFPRGLVALGVSAGQNLSILMLSIPTPTGRLKGFARSTQNKANEELFNQTVGVRTVLAKK